MEEKMQNLHDALKWALNYISKGNRIDTPKHDCEYKTNPEKGYCEFHDKYWKAEEILKAHKIIIMGVGSGGGRLFVYGDYESIKAMQKIIFERDGLKTVTKAFCDTISEGF